MSIPVSRLSYFITHRLQCMPYTATFGFVANDLHLGFETAYVLKKQIHSQIIDDSHVCISWRNPFALASSDPMLYPKNHFQSGHCLEGNLFWGHAISIHFCSSLHCFTNKLWNVGMVHRYMRSQLTLPNSARFGHALWLR